jgi:ribokinase
MNNLLVAGSIGLDDIKTPFGAVKSTLGGSGVYASLAASYFAKPRLVSIAGQDFFGKNLDYLKSRRIDLQNVEFSGETFRWQGRYEFDMNEAKTIKTELNSLANFKPKLNQAAKECRHLLLGNSDPTVQLSIINQLSGDPFIVLDTMNYWIESKREELTEVIKKVDLVVVNEGEARQLFKTVNLIQAGRQLLELGAGYAIIKKGEHGALLFSNQEFFSAPGYPLAEVVDPTGCGDSFAGGLIGYLAGQWVSRSASQQVSKSASQRVSRSASKQVSGSAGQRDSEGGSNQVGFEQIKKAVIYGSATASFCAEYFGSGYVDKIKLKDIEERYDFFKKIGRF